MLASTATVFFSSGLDAIKGGDGGFPVHAPARRLRSPHPPDSPAGPQPAQSPCRHQRRTPICHDTPETSGTSRFSRESDISKRAVPDMYVIAADICVILLGESSISQSHGLRQFPSRHQPGSLQHSRLKPGCVSTVACARNLDALFAVAISAK